MWEASETIHKGIFIAFNAYIRKTEKNKIKVNKTKIKLLSIRLIVRIIHNKINQ